MINFRKRKNEFIWEKTLSIFIKIFNQIPEMKKNTKIPFNTPTT